MKSIYLLLVTSFALSAQPAFEVASIKQAAPQALGRVMVRMGGDPSRVDYANVSLKDVLARAYGVKRYQINGPSWLDSERYDIAAKVPDGVSTDQIPAMLQTLLAERFHMTVRKESKEQAIYALIVGKDGPKLKAAEVDPNSAVTVAPDGRKIQGGRGMIQMSNDGHFKFSRAGMSQFSDMLSNMLDRPVIDMTGLTGNYDIDLNVSTEELVGMKRMVVGAGPMMRPGGEGGDHGPAPDAAPSASIFSAVQQLGLKLDPRKGPVEFVYVDKADKVPTEN